MNPLPIYLCGWGIPMNWKKLFLTSVGVGLGLTIGVGASVGVYAYWSNRPKPPRVWNTKAIICSDPPGFSSEASSQTIELAYELSNKTSEDYEISADSAETRLLFRVADEALTEPLPSETAKIKRTTFLPAQQTGTMTIVVKMGPGLPKQLPGESDDDFHERLRDYCKTQIRGKGFVLFDEKNKFEVDLTNISVTNPKARHR